MTLRASAIAAFVPQVLAKSGLPFVVPPTGTMGNNGAFTAGTALPRTIAQGFMWFAAAQISAGSLAGWYYFTGQSATGFTIFNNTYASGVPTVPSSPTAFVTTGPGAITGVTTAVTGPQITIPAGTLGLNGILRTTLLWSVNASVNTKTIAAQVNAGANYAAASLNTAAQFGGNFQWDTFNQQSQSSQLTANSGVGVGVAAGANVATTYNFAVAATWSAQMTDAVATDWQILEGFLLEAMP